MMVWALITCYSRIYLGVHYPGDLLVGALIGAASASAVYYPLTQLLKWEENRRTQASASSVSQGAVNTNQVVTLQGWAFPIAIGLITLLGIAIYSFFVS